MTEGDIAIVLDHEYFINNKSSDYVGRKVKIIHYFTLPARCLEYAVLFVDTGEIDVLPYFTLERIA